MPVNVGGYEITREMGDYNSRLSIAGNYVTDGLQLYLDAGISDSYPGSGTSWFDLSPSGIDGTLINGPTYDSGNGGSIVFDGTDDYTQIPLPSTAVSNVTVEVWVEVILGTNGAFFKVGDGCNGYSMGIGNTTLANTGNNIIGLFPCIRWVPTSVSYGSSGWKHCVMTLNGSSAPTFYVNGSVIGTFAGTAPVTPTNSMFLARNFGDEPEGASVRAYNGKIAGAKFYNRELSLQEIQQNFNAIKNRYGI